MTVNSKQLGNLPVETESGTRIGYIHHFEIDELEQRVAHYVVKPHPGIAGVFDKDFVVAVSQVVSLTKEKLVVDDLFVSESVELETKKNTLRKPAAT
ncbi:MAG: PRC-barrel domain-containing protein [bacterium]|nr:PRC-barrel domain-containing protein [bacterium]